VYLLESLKAYYLAEKGSRASALHYDVGMTSIVSPSSPKKYGLFFD
jgi:hypothetical protein